MVFAKLVCVLAAAVLVQAFDLDLAHPPAKDKCDGLMIEVIRYLKNLDKQIESFRGVEDETAEKLSDCGTEYTIDEVASCVHDVEHTYGMKAALLMNTQAQAGLMAKSYLDKVESCMPQKSCSTALDDSRDQLAELHQMIETMNDMDLTFFAKFSECTKNDDPECYGDLVISTRLEHNAALTKTLEWKDDNQENLDRIIQCRDPEE